MKTRTQKMKHAAPNPSRNKLATLLWAVLVSGCSMLTPAPEIKLSEGHIARPADKTASIPAPIQISTYLPPPAAGEKPQTYSVVVNEVPVKELLFALARDSKLNIDVHPSIQGLVTLNAVNVSLSKLLDRVSEQVSLRYRLEDNSLIITPDTPYFKTYRINYINISRNTSSTIGVATQIASTGSSTATGGSSTGGGGGTNNSTTTVDTTSKNDFWQILTDNIVSILKASRAQLRSAEERALQAELAKSEREERLRQVEVVSQAGQGAPTLFSSAFGHSGSGSASVGDIKNEVIANPVAGTISILGTEREHKLIRQYVDSVMTSAQRQVLIEATIVEIRLSDEFQAGVDWSKVIAGAGFSFTQSLLAGNLGTAPFFSIGYLSTTGSDPITATLKALSSYGNAKVLSSPKLMALNNQTALLKVVNNVVYFQIDAVESTTAVTGGGTVNAFPTFTTTAQTVPVGVVMSVTPQVNDNSSVSLTVRPTVSRVQSFVNDPNPALQVAPDGTPLATPILNPVPQIQVQEMESVLQINNGQTVILGGLMQDIIQKDKDAVPGIGRIKGGIGDLFSFRNESNTKTELVIFLRATIIDNPTLESDELKFYRRYLPQAPSAGSKP